MVCIRATCVEGHCRCATSEDVLTQCRPGDNRKSNIIGGPCPCTQPHAECNMAQDICLCAADYVSTSDRRRCISEVVSVTGVCEVHSQCQAKDSFTICNENRTCQCREGFTLWEGTCVSIVGQNSTSCTSDSQCQLYGAQAKCVSEKNQCTCGSEEISTADGKNCVRNIDFNEECTEHAQCQRNSGAGAACTAGICCCQAGYYPQKRNAGTDFKCSPIIVLGKYCRLDEQCYQHHLADSEQSMVCDHGECNCRWGYKSMNNVNCSKANFAEAPVIHLGLVLLAVGIWSTEVLYYI